MDAWCWACGADHQPPRGKGCKKEALEGYSAMPTRSKGLDTAKMTPSEAAAAVVEELSRSLAEVKSEDKFPSSQEYVEYLEALHEEEMKRDAVEELQAKIRARITARVQRGKPSTVVDDAPPPPSRDPSPERHPRTSTRLFDTPPGTEGRDTSADRLSKSRRRFDLKRFTRGREPRSLSYAELMYVSLNWAAVGIEEGTFASLGQIKKFLKHLGFLSFKASSELYKEAMFAEYDADLREECIWEKDIDEFCFGNDALTKRYFDTEGLRKINNDNHNHQGGKPKNKPPKSKSAGNQRTDSNYVKTTETGQPRSCDRFNRSGCDTRDCNFAHICNKCHDPTHKAVDCSNVRMYTG